VGKRRAAVARALSQAGLGGARRGGVAERLVDPLLAQAHEHAQRVVLEREQRAEIEGLGLPVRELELLGDGVDLGGLYRLAESLRKQAAAASGRGGDAYDTSEDGPDGAPDAPEHDGIDGVADGLDPVASTPPAGHSAAPEDGNDDAWVEEAAEPDDVGAGDEAEDGSDGGAGNSPGTARDGGSDA
jgi:hypothetical protein